MNFLIQVGKSSWVDPDAIQAIEWNDLMDCPTLLLSGQQRVNAYNFKNLASAETPSNAEAGTIALLDFIGQKMWELRESGGRTLDMPGGQ
jgi:hypothetical protein